MANEQQASSANGGFRVGALSPEDAERFAALFIPTWDMPPEVPTDGPDPGFKVAPSDSFDIALIARPGAAEIPPSEDAAKKKEAADVAGKKTMMGIAAPLAPEAPLPAPPERAPAVKQTMMGLADPIPAPTAPTPEQVSNGNGAGLFASSAPAASTEQAAAPARPLFAPAIQAPSSVDTTDSYAAMKKKPPYAIIGGGVVVLLVAIIFFATRGGDKPEVKPSEDNATVSEPKKLDLPDPNAVSAAATTTTTAKATATATATETATAAPTTTTTAAETTTAAATATATAPEPKVTATAKPPEPKVTATAKPPAPPPPKATVTATAKPVKPPPPKATATAKPPAKKPPAVKEDF